jgi:hypothetical protein
VFPDFQNPLMFTSALQDQCILQWKIEFEDQSWELDYNDVVQDKLDPFAEVPGQDKFTTLNKEVWSERRDISEIRQSKSQKKQVQESVHLELDQVIGRRAFDRRNNVKVDVKDRIVYIAGSMIVYLWPNANPKSGKKTGHGRKYNQLFLSPDQSTRNSHPEISCFQLSKDKRMLFIGTAQNQAQLIVWEISTHTMVNKITLESVSVILFITCAYDNQHLIVIGLTKDYLQCIILLDTLSGTTIAYKQLLGSAAYKIKSACFEPKSTRKFVTCGVQHLTFWTMTGRHIEAAVGPIMLNKG